MVNLKELNEKDLQEISGGLEVKSGHKKEAYNCQVGNIPNIEKPRLNFFSSFFNIFKFK
jgi:bacteriocin-like protein